MRIHPAAFFVVSALLAISVLVNVMALTRLREVPPAPRPTGPGTAFRPAPSERSEEASTFAPSSSASPVPLDAAGPEPSGAPKSPAGAGPSAAPSTLRRDPKIAAVLEAQEKFDVLWKDLDRLQKARDRIEEAHYFQTVLSETMDFLELGEPSRPHFVEATRSAVASMQQARREYEEGRKALPPKDKNNAAAQAAHDEQKNRLDAQYGERMSAAVNSLKTQLTAGHPRHGEFLGRADRWLRNLVPKNAP